MKTINIFIVTIFCVFVSSAQVSISKNDILLTLKENLEKSRDVISDARCDWRYNNTDDDYFIKDTIILNSARSYRADYCKEIRWSFYENTKFVLENTHKCSEPPTMLRPKKEDYLELMFEEKNESLYLILNSSKNIIDKFRVLKFYRNIPLINEESTFDYTLVLLRNK
jgi:hypothetical protein